MNNKYKFKTFKDYSIDMGSSIIALATYGFALSQVFNPLFLMVGGTILALGTLATKLSLKEKSSALNDLKSEVLYKKQNKMLEDLAIKMGFSKIPQFIVLYDDQSQHYFSAAPGSNTIYASKAALKNHSSDDDKLKFIFAHELAHLKTDKNSPSLWTEFACKKGSKGALLLGVLTTLSAAIIGISNPILVPVITAKSVIFFIGSYTASYFSIKLASRSAEKCADRNALYITRNLSGAIKTMDSLHSTANKELKISLFEEAFYTHPTYNKRIKSLTSAFNTVSKYPVENKSSLVNVNKYIRNNHFNNSER